MYVVAAARESQQSLTQRIAGEFADVRLLNQLSITHLARWLKFHISILEPDRRFTKNVLLQVGTVVSAGSVVCPSLLLLSPSLPLYGCLSPLLCLYGLLVTLPCLPGPQAVSVSVSLCTDDAFRPPCD